MHRTTLNQIKTVLDRIPIHKKNPVVFVHSGLFPFGLLEGGVSGICETLIDWVGHSGTLLMPTFTFRKLDVWHENNTPGETGVLTEYFRKLPCVRRTIHPIHSVAVYGEQAEYLTSEIDSSSFGPKSLFAKLFELKATNISLGTEFEGGATYLHYIEELAKVPYREYVELTTKVVNSKGENLDNIFKYFARVKKNDFEWCNNWGLVWDDLVANKMINLEKIGPAKIIYSDMYQVGDFFLQQLNKNPLYCAVKK